jgi:hypothetical protein
MNTNEDELAKEILLALLQNPARYNYVSDLVEKGLITQEQANMKNINKAFKIAKSFMKKLGEVEF